jgi:putative ABC transport system ATP-binding protein
MQRVAIARALVNSPDILLADEPTGNLDSKRSLEIGEVLKSLNEKEGLTVLLVTHNPVLAKLAGRTVELRDGRIAL